MGSLVISNKLIEKYFGYLKHFDDKAKESLISKLKKSISPKTNKEFKIESLFGAWEDDKSTEEIISEIKKSRLNKKDTQSF